MIGGALKNDAYKSIRKNTKATSNVFFMLSSFKLNNAVIMPIAINIYS